MAPAAGILVSHAYADNAWYRAWTRFRGRFFVTAITLLAIGASVLALVHFFPSSPSQPPASSVQEFATPTANSAPFGITVGPDGALWFTEFASNRIGRITA